MCCSVIPASLVLILAFFVFQHSGESSSEEPIGISNRNPDYQRFPRDPELRKAWVEACGRKGPFNPDSSFVCSAHFPDTDIVTNIMAEWSFAKKKIRLRKGAVPSLGLVAQPSPQIVIPESTESAEKVSPAITDPQCKLPSIAAYTPESSIEEKYYKLLQIHEELKNEYLELKEVSGSRITNLQCQIDHLMNKSDVKLYDALSQLFTKKQIDFLMRNRREIKEWPEEELKEKLSSSHTAQTGSDLSKDVTTMEADDSDFPALSQADSEEEDEEVEMSSQGVRCLAGLVAQKLKKSHPELTDDCLKEHDYHGPDSYTPPPWLSHLPFKKSNPPSEAWLRAAEELERIIDQTFGDAILKRSPLRVTLCEATERLPDIPVKALETYILQRIMIRVKYLNEMKNNKNLKLKR